MIRRPATRLALAAAASTLLLLGATGCGVGDASVNTDPKQGGAGSSDGKASKAATAKVGDTLTLHGMEQGSQLDVTIKKWADPATPADEFTTPEAGKRWVAAQFLLTNTGKKTYADAPSNGAQALDGDGQRFDTTFGDVTAGPSMTTDAKVPPGGKALGWIVFEVPKGVKVSDVQFAMDSGMSDESGQWKIP